MIRRLMCVFALSLFVASAHAQLAAYGMVSVTRMSGIQGSPLAAPFGTGGVNDSVNPLGGTFGAYYNFMNVGPFRLGADVRGSIQSTRRGAQVGSDAGGARVSSALGGVRGAIRTPLKAVDGYLQASAGLGKTDYGLLLPSNRQNAFEYHVYAGMQIHVTPIADFRLFEVGYGGLDGGGHNYPLKSISTGVVFHFPSAQ